MRFEPFGQKGLRSLMSRMRKEQELDAGGTLLARSEIALAGLIVALLLGFGVGSQIGTENTDQAEPPVVEAQGPNDSADVSETQVANTDVSETGLAEYVSASIAIERFDEPTSSTVSALYDADSTTHGGGGSEYATPASFATISVDSLPIHRTKTRPDTIDSLTIVTHGEIGSGESLGSSLRRQGISPGTVHLIATEMRKVFDFRRSRPGDTYRLGQDGDGRVLDFRYAQGPEESFYLAWEGTRYIVKKESAELRPQIAKIAGVVDSSFYGAILALGEQSALASDFARILAWDIDFSRNVHPGDEFQILYERLYRRDDDGEEVYVRPGRILAGRYAGNVGEHTIVYFEDERGIGAYFRPDGSSVERAFLAAPLEFSRISSRFSRARRHPILNVTRPHPGIDYAAPRGTPIWAVADGVVEYRARAGASGNLVRIRHSGGYTSHYAHLSKFAEGLKVGDRVEQKQLIGYVGSTGLSTGPHVCFRVKKDGRYVDPMRIASPAGESIDETKLVVFESVRDELLADLGSGSLSLVDEAL